MNVRDVLYESPDEVLAQEGHYPPVKAEPQSVAAGLPAVFSTLSYVVREPGLVRGTQALLKLNQEDGVDCSSCAWPDPDDHRSTFEFCENGAKALADETTKKQIGPDFFARYGVEELSRLTDFKLNNLGRLTHPLYLDQNSCHYQPISWGDAFKLLARELKALENPNQAAFYTSGRASNEAAFLYGTLVRILGSNNLPDCSNMCHESSGTALTRTIGIGKGTVTLGDFETTSLILVIGQNPGTNHPRMLTALQKAKQAGARIVSINPLAETGLTRFKNPQDYVNPHKALRKSTPLADSHIPIRLGGDLAFLKGVQKALIEWFDDGRPTVDVTFIETLTQGFQDVATDLRAESWSDIIQACGVKEETIRSVAAWCASTDRIIVCWAMGITQHVHSVPTIEQIVNLLLMRGAFGKPGAGACPVRGHSNVQGDRTVGIDHAPKPAFLERLGREFQFTPPTKPGLDVVKTIEAMQAGAIKVFMALGGNFLSASPDTALVAKGLAKCQLTVAVATKLNRSHLVTGAQALLLPCLGRTDSDFQQSGPQLVSCENSMGKVQRSQGFLEPPSASLLSEVAILCELAVALDVPHKERWQAMRANYDLIRERIERVVPGFEHYNKRLRQQGGFYLPNGPREGHFPTPTGKAILTVAVIPQEDKAPEELYLMTIRSHDQFNTVVYSYADRYRGIKDSRRVVLISKEDLELLHLKAGQKVNVISSYQGEERRVDGFTLVEYPIPKDCVAAYFPEANPLVPLNHRDPESGCPASKKIAVRLEICHA